MVESMSVPSIPRRTNPTVVILGILLIVCGVVIAATRALGFISFGQDRFVLVPIPTDAFPSWEAPFFLNYSIAAGLLLIFVGAIMVAAWLGYVRGVGRRG